jgi:hypothetical protein
MKIAIMQPYLFPYIGYFQMINAVDHFVFYDDVNFIKGGWINRNNILSNGEKQFFTLQLQGASSFKKINEIQLGKNSSKIIKSIVQAYSKAPYFNEVFPLIERVFIENSPHSTIADIAIKSVQEICLYLNIRTKLEISSLNYKETQHLKGEERIFEICKLNQADTYINSPGGSSLYKKEDFAEKDIQLFFIENNSIIYKQFSEKFIPYLSIIDVMMFNNKVEIKKILHSFKLN